jgi:hypothetical protein
VVSRGDDGGVGVRVGVRGGGGVDEQMAWRSRHGLRGVVVSWCHGVVLTVSSPHVRPRSRAQLDLLSLRQGR